MEEYEELEEFEEFSIMPKDMMWETERFSGSHRHEVFGGSNRKHSIEDGLVIYLTPEMHNMSNRGIHFNTAFRDYSHVVGQRAYMEHYNASVDDFIKRYGRNYL